jgi:hypothetical protein
MISCRQFRGRIDEYLDQRLSADDEYQLETHKYACPRCREVFQYALRMMIIERGYFGNLMEPGSYSTGSIPLTEITDNDLKLPPWMGTSLFLLQHSTTRETGFARYFVYLRSKVYRDQDCDPAQHKLKVELINAHDPSAVLGKAYLTQLQPQAELLGDKPLPATIQNLSLKASIEDNQ